jgi:hypothetical protein
MKRHRKPRSAPTGSLKPGCFVKKCYKAKRVWRGPYKGQPVSRECMWIKITKITSDGYEGKLANNPIAVRMRFGQKVRVKRSEVTQTTCERARIIGQVR